MTQTEERDIVIRACQSRAWQLWGYDNYFEDHKREGLELIQAVFNLYGVQLDNPWEPK